METTLEVTPRSETGKGWARKARSNGKLPGVMYGPGREPQAFSTDPATLLGIFKHTKDHNTVLDVTVEGAKGKVPCLVRDLQRHPVTREPIHLDLYAVPTKAPIEVMVPLETEGTPAGAILGGRLRLIRRQVRVLCKYDAIPTALTIEVSKMEIGDMVKASEIKLPKGVSLVLDNDYNVLTVYGKRVMSESNGDADGADAGEEGATEGDSDAAADGDAEATE